MKTITDTATALSKFLVADDVVITHINDNTQIKVGEPAMYIIGCMDITNATIYEDVTNSPEDWTGNKYFFDGTDWDTNPDWVDPTLEDGE